MSSASPTPEGRPVAARRYRSSRRADQAEQTRDAILATAAELFTKNGWAATGMREVARTAGVATETVYAHFGSKTALFQRAMDVAVVGDDALVALADRPEFAAIAQGPRPGRIAAAAALTTHVNQRTVGFAKAMREAAPTDVVIADMLKATRDRVRQNISAGAASVMGREPTDRERDGLWAVLSVEVFLLLIEQSGWTIPEYQTWLTETLERLIPTS